MKRREIICTGILVAVTGCTDMNTNEEKYDRITIFRGVIIEDVPSEASVTPFSDIEAGAILNGLFDQIERKSEIHQTYINSEEYDYVDVTEFTTEQAKEATNSLDNIPEYTGDVGINGYYIEKDDTILAVQYEIRSS